MRGPGRHRLSVLDDHEGEAVAYESRQGGGEVRRSGLPPNRSSRGRCAQAVLERAVQARDGECADEVRAKGGVAPGVEQDRPERARCDPVERRQAGAVRDPDAASGIPCSSSTRRTTAAPALLVPCPAMTAPSTLSSCSALKLSLSRSITCSMLERGLETTEASGRPPARTAFTPPGTRMPAPRRARRNRWAATSAGLRASPVLVLQRSTASADSAGDSRR